MSATITVEEAPAHLKELIAKLAPDEVIVITHNDNPVAKLVGHAVPKPRLRPPPGLGKGMIRVVADDDEHLRDFTEYMP